MTIPATRSSTTSFDAADDVDKYLPRVKPAALSTFGRVRQSRQRSPDRRTLTFSITDREMPEAYPDGVGSIRVTHRVATHEKRNRLTWIGTISGTLTMAAGVPKERVMEKIQLIVADRIGAGNQKNNLMAARWGGKGFLVTEAMEFSDDVFGRGAR